jgi:hypothetical protein
MKVKAGMEHFAALTKGGCRRCRTFLTVAVSSDHGATWQEVASIESEVRFWLRPEGAHLRTKPNPAQAEEKRTPPFLSRTLR